MSAQIVFARNGQALTNSVIIAEHTANTHQAMLKLIRGYLSDFESFGRVGFEIQPFETKGGVQKREIALLNEQQATLLVTYCKNTEIVRKFKVALVKAFYEMRTKLLGGPTANNSKAVNTLTPAQQLLVQQAVGRRAQRTASHYQTIYRAIKLRFQIARYDQLPQSQLNECLAFIEGVDLNVPEAKETVYNPRQKTYTVTADFLERQRILVYNLKYLFNKPLMQAMRVMQALDIPDANKLCDAVHDMNLVQVERNLEQLGFAVKDLDCYKHWLANN